MKNNKSRALFILVTCFLMISLMTGCHAILVYFGFKIKDKGEADGGSIGQEKVEEKHEHAGYCPWPTCGCMIGEDPEESLEGVKRCDKNGNGDPNGDYLCCVKCSRICQRIPL